MTYGGKCNRCGRPLKLLFTSWYCDCADFGSDFIAFSILHDDNVTDFTAEGGIPVGALIHLFRDRKAAEDLAQAFLGFSLVRVTVTPEQSITWSSGEALHHHEVSSKLPFEVVQ